MILSLHNVGTRNISFQEPRFWGNCLPDSFQDFGLKFHYDGAYHKFKDFVSEKKW